MAKQVKAGFTYMWFGYSYGDKDIFVAHQKKYRKQDVADLCNEACKGLPNLRPCTVDDVEEAYVKYYIRPTAEMEPCNEPVYGFADRKERGAFPVYVVARKDLEV